MNLEIADFLLAAEAHGYSVMCGAGNHDNSIVLLRIHDSAQPEIEHIYIHRSSNGKYYGSKVLTELGTKEASANYFSSPMYWEVRYKSGEIKTYYLTGVAGGPTIMTLAYDKDAWISSLGVFTPHSNISRAVDPTFGVWTASV